MREMYKGAVQKPLREWHNTPVWRLVLLCLIILYRAEGGHGRKTNLETQKRREVNNSVSGLKNTHVVSEVA